MVARIKKNDKVVVLSGKDKQKQGAVIEILPKIGKIKVKDVAVVTRHCKARKAGEIGGIKKEESFIDMAKVMPICVSCKKACRVQTKILENGKRARSCGRCEAIF
jgi:large subunit ribosomal protein L24